LFAAPPVVLNIAAKFVAVTANLSPWLETAVSFTKTAPTEVMRIRS
jgi:hypothetical protein